MKTINQIKNWELMKRLEEYKRKTNSWIAECVINEAEMYEDIVCFFTDLLNHGCISWMIGSLIYYQDTHRFYDEHYYEIEEIRKRLQEEWCLNELPDTDLKNYFAWLSFEETAREIANDLEIEV